MSATLEVPVLVLAGGFGTRLRTAVSDVPKPLAPVGGSPFLKHLLRAWRGQGARRFVFLLHHDAEKMKAFLRQEQEGGVLTGCEISSLIEGAPLGTGGAVANAVREGAVAGRFLVANADTWLGSGIAELASATAPAIAVVRVPNTDRYGQVRIANGKIEAFEEKSESAGSGWINAGLYLLDARQFEGWDGTATSMERDLFPPLAQSGALRAVAVTADFIDIGIPDDYHRFCRWIESGRTSGL